MRSDEKPTMDGSSSRAVGLHKTQNGERKKGTQGTADPMTRRGGSTTRSHPRGTSWLEPNEVSRATNHWRPLQREGGNEGLASRWRVIAARSHWSLARWGGVGSWKTQKTGSPTQGGAEKEWGRRGVGGFDALVVRERRGCRKAGCNSRGRAWKRDFRCTSRLLLLVAGRESGRVSTVGKGS